MTRPLDTLPDVGRLSLIGHSEAACVRRQAGSRKRRLRTWLVDVLSADAGFSSPQHQPRRRRHSAFTLPAKMARIGGDGVGMKNVPPHRNPRHVKEHIQSLCVLEATCGLFSHMGRGTQPGPPPSIARQTSSTSKKCE